MKILVTGGTGFIGSHTCVELLENGYEVVVIDDLSNSKKEVLQYIHEITGKDVTFYEGNVGDYALLSNIFDKESIDAVIHFAGYKAVGESVREPLKYYRNNLDSTITLLEVMKHYGCHQLVFSSSATVYGSPKALPIQEDFSLSTTNPYGTTKLMIEMMLRDVAHAIPEMRIAVLRYFNPIGAHPSGLIGENPNDIPNNLMPYIVNVATKKADCLRIFGSDYDTPDGTGVRDYIHVVDLARGHIRAIETLAKTPGIDFYNLGTGRGLSVLELVHTFEKVNQIKIPYEVVARRAGDIASCYADPSYAKEKLGFVAEYGIEQMCRDSYRYVEKRLEK